MKGERQDSKAGKPKATAKKSRDARLERKVAEIKAKLEKLPADRQEQFNRELEEGKEH